MKATGATPDTATSLVAASNKIMDELLERKKSLFPDINRSIIDYDLIKTPKGLHLNIVSNISKDEVNSQNK